MRLLSLTWQQKITSCPRWWIVPRPQSYICSLKPYRPHERLSGLFLSKPFPLIYDLWKWIRPGSSPLSSLDPDSIRLLQPSAPSERSALRLDFVRSGEISDILTLSQLIGSYSDVICFLRDKDRSAGWSALSVSVPPFPLSRQAFQFSLHVYRDFHKSSFYFVSFLWDAALRYLWTGFAMNRMPLMEAELFEFIFLKSKETES